MGCSPSHEGLYGETALNNCLTEAKRGDPKLKSLNSVTFVEHDLVWSAGKEHKLKPTKFGQVNQAIRTLALTSTKFMQQQVSWLMMIHILIHTNLKPLVVVSHIIFSNY